MSAPACAHCGASTTTSTSGHACCPDCHWELHEEPHRVRVELAPVPWDVAYHDLEGDDLAGSP